MVTPDNSPTLRMGLSQKHGAATQQGASRPYEGVESFGARRFHGWG